MMVLVCDEEANSTFVIDGISSPYDYIGKTKLELKQTLNVKNFIWTDVYSWKQKLEELLMCFRDVEVCNEDLSKANENNELMIHGKKYLTISALGKLKTIDASQGKTEKIIRENNIQGVKGKSKTNRTLDFYSFEEIKKHTNVDRDLPKANENNELIIDGKKYLTIKSLGKLEIVDASETKIKKIIEENNIQGVKAKDKGNRPLDFYSIEEVKKYTNNNEDLPKANEDNEIIIDDLKYLTIGTLRRLEIIDHGTIKKIIKENNIQRIKGKDKRNQVFDFYSVEEVKKYINVNLEKANEDNEIVNEDEKKYLTIYQLSKLETVDASRGTIEKIIRENNIQGIKGKSRTGIRDFYPVEEVKKYINVNKDLEKANEDNEVLDEDGKRYLTVNSLGRLSEVCASARKIEKIIKENNIQSIKGKKRGQVCNFYPIEEVKKYTNV